MDIKTWIYFRLGVIEDGRVKKIQKSIDFTQNDPVPASRIQATGHWIPAALL